MMHTPLIILLAVGTLIGQATLLASAITVGPGASPAGGYLPLSAFGIAPIPGMTHGSSHSINVPGFSWGGATFTQINISSNGYITVGGSNAGAFLNQSLPDSNNPNGVIAPYWTDLDPGAAGAIRVGVLTDGLDNWIVVDWEGVAQFGLPANTYSVQIWLGIGSDAHPGEDITFAYGPLASTPALLTVGAENIFGNVGANYYYNGTGTAPVSGQTQLRVSSREAPNAVPEPSTWLSLAAGTLLLAGFRRIRS
ncbi:MAG: PEP-CTERM sorting domain-containing protein [Bryobacter sp.]|jgi:hypothetical protein|nr:PEP-CTERM sorting domain-containing protein [Bryobacter sp.]